MFFSVTFFIRRAKAKEKKHLHNFFKHSLKSQSSIDMVCNPFGGFLLTVGSTTLLLHNRDLSEYVIPYRSFAESFDYHKQSLRNYKNMT